MSASTSTPSSPAAVPEPGTSTSTPSIPPAVPLNQGLSASDTTSIGTDEVKPSEEQHTEAALSAGTPPPFPQVSSSSSSSSSAPPPFGDPEPSLSTHVEREVKEKKTEEKKEEEEKDTNGEKPPRRQIWNFPIKVTDYELVDEFEYSDGGFTDEFTILPSTPMTFDDLSYAIYFWSKRKQRGDKVIFDFLSESEKESGFSSRTYQIEDGPLNYLMMVIFEIIVPYAQIEVAKKALTDLVKCNPMWGVHFNHGFRIIVDKIELVDDIPGCPNLARVACLRQMYNYDFDCICEAFGRALTHKQYLVLMVGSYTHEEFLKKEEEERRKWREEWEIWQKILEEREKEEPEKKKQKK